MSKQAPPRAYCVYILECADGTLYTGITTELVRRVHQHNSGKSGARYTHARRPVRCIYVEPSPDRSSALKRELAIKRLARRAKLALVAQNPWREAAPKQ
jgi:putative endonuclease